MSSGEADFPFCPERKILLIEAHFLLLFRKACNSSPCHSRGRQPYKASRSPPADHRCAKNQLSSGIFCTMDAGSHVVSFWFHPLLRCETFCQLLSLSEPTVRHGPTGSPRNVALRIKYEHVCVLPKCLLRLDVWPSSIIPINRC